MTTDKHLGNCDDLRDLFGLTFECCCYCHSDKDNKVHCDFVPPLEVPAGYFTVCCHAQSAYDFRNWPADVGAKIKADTETVDMIDVAEYHRRKEGG